MTPWWGVWAAVVRRELTTGEILAPEERLNIQEALTLHQKRRLRWFRREEQGITRARQIC